MLQRVAVCCSLLQCVAVFGNVTASSRCKDRHTLMHVCIRTQIATDIDTVVTILIVESGEMSQNGQRIVHCASTDLCCACVRMVGVCA